MELFTDAGTLERYLVENSQQEDSVLRELARHTYLKEVHPRMLSGHILGSFLSMFSKMLSPERILEIGTYTGYSAICLARGLRPGGTLTTIEINDELRTIARKFFRKANLHEQIELINGDALEVIPTLTGPFDLIFMDAHKDDYPDYYNLVIDRVATGGYILADNVLWGGKVLDANLADPTTRTIDQFNKMITADQRVENFLLPIRDGIMVIKKNKQTRSTYC
ncbi:MAG: O-methyltransferase [Bacteroidales bacterium]|nr:O-methyltransferase [Bacteroidales bacterium]